MFFPKFPAVYQSSTKDEWVRHVFVTKITAGGHKIKLFFFFFQFLANLSHFLKNLAEILLLTLDKKFQRVYTEMI